MTFINDDEATIMEDAADLEVVNEDEEGNSMQVIEDNNKENEKDILKEIKGGDLRDFVDFCMGLKIDMDYVSFLLRLILYKDAALDLLGKINSKDFVKKHRENFPKIIKQILLLKKLKRKGDENV